MGLNLGALAGGLATGYLTGNRLGQDNQRAEREAEQWKYQKDELDSRRETAGRAKAVNAMADDEYKRLGTTSGAIDQTTAEELAREGALSNAAGVTRGAGEAVKTSEGTQVGLANVKQSIAQRLAAAGYGKEAEAARQEYERYKSEGVDKAITAFKRGDSPQDLEKIFNDHGDNKIKINGIDYKTGDMRIVDPASGGERVLNAFTIEKRMLSLKDQSAINKADADIRKDALQADQIEAENKAGLPQARVAQVKASASASNASAAHSSAGAETARYGLAQTRLADQALAKPENERTPAENAAIANRGVAHNGPQDPPEVKTAKWMVSNGVAKDATDAWEKLRTAKGKSRAEIKADLITHDKLGDYQGPEGASRLEQVTNLIFGQANAPQGSSAPGLSSSPTANPNRRPLADFGN